MVEKESDIIGKTSNPIQVINDAVNELYLYRDQYFETHSIEDAKHKNSDVKKQLDGILKLFEELKDDILRLDKSQYYYLLGRAYSVLAIHSEAGEEALSKAIKLSPYLIEAWNLLGEAYWRRNDIQGAKNCFNGALAKARNKVSLRSMSMVLRAEASTCKVASETRDKVREGLTLAKEALALDVSDGESWSTLGTAHMAEFFAIRQDPQTLKHVCAAYDMAEKDPVEKNKADLHYNKAMAFKFEEEYEAAVKALMRAQQLEPDWEQPYTKKQQLLAYLDNTQQLILLKGKLKPKKIKSLIKSLEGKCLGPYQGGNFVSLNRKSVNLKLVPLAELSPGINLEKVVVGRVVCTVHDEDTVPFTFCLMDQNSTVVAVTVYNLAQGKGVIIGDSVAIPDPYLTRHCFIHDEKTYSFPSIRVDNPIVMVVNSKKLGRDFLASVQFSTFNIPH